MEIHLNAQKEKLETVVVSNHNYFTDNEGACKQTKDWKYILSAGYIYLVLDSTVNVQ